MQAVGVLLGQLAQLRREDHGVLVLVRVDEHNVAAAGMKRRLQDRQDGRDAASAGEQQQVGIKRFGREDTAGDEAFELVADCERVVDPVRPEPVVDPLHRDAHRLVAVRRAAQRIAASDRSRVERQAQRQELAGGVGEVDAGRRFEHDRARVGGLAHDLGDPQPMRVDLHQRIIGTASVTVAHTRPRC